MTESKAKPREFLESVFQEARSIIYQGKDKNAIVAQIQALLEKKMVESFKNGISVGMKKAKSQK